MVGLWNFPIQMFAVQYNQLTWSIYVYFIYDDLEKKFAVLVLVKSLKSKMLNLNIYIRVRRFCCKLYIFRWAFDHPWPGDIKNSFRFPWPMAMECPPKWSFFKSDRERKKKI